MLRISQLLPQLKILWKVKEGKPWNKIQKKTEIEDLKLDPRLEKFNYFCEKFKDEYKLNTFDDFVENPVQPYRARSYLFVMWLIRGF